MKIETIIVVVIGFLIAGIAIFNLYLITTKSKAIRRRSDKPIPQYKSAFKSPTWRFQKFHPGHCPHETGIYRKVIHKVLDETIEKCIFVCADCVSMVELEELEQRDKFKS